jgi:osmotically-inducible protein OsmY
MKKLAALVASATLAALAVGCTDTANTNTNATNANSNTAVVVNNNGNANTAGVTTTNANTANANSNSSRYRAGMTKEEYEKNKESYSTEAKSTGSKIGTGAEDGWLWVKTRSALLAENDLRESTINVDVDNGVITLNGTVSNAEQVKKADTVAKGIEGKKSVVNKLKVSAGGDTNKNANANMSPKKG